MEKLFRYPLYCQGKVIRITACIVGYFLFGAFYAEILNSFDAPYIRFNVYVFGIVTALAFLVFDLVLNHYKSRSELSDQDAFLYNKVKRYYYVCLSIIGFVLLIMVPLVWWGAIRKLAEDASKGVY
jgi:Trk-type K+ transport system membrane component